MNLEDNEIIKDQFEVVDVPLNEVGDEEVIIYQVTIGDANDVMNIYDYLCKSSNHRVFGRCHKKIRNVLIAYYFMDVLGFPPKDK